PGRPRGGVHHRAGADGRWRAEPRGGGRITAGRPTGDSPPDSGGLGGGSMPTKDEIFQKVRTTLVDALNVDEDEVALTSRLRADLNAESIDFLDIVFRLEKQFGVKIPREELFPESIFQGDPQFVTDGRVNAE